MAYYVEASTLSDAQWQVVAAELHDRMMESVFDSLDDAQKLFSHHQPAPVQSVICWGRGVRRRSTQTCVLVWHSQKMKSTTFRMHSLS